MKSTNNLRKYATDPGLLADKPGNLAELIEELQSYQETQTVTPDDAEAAGNTVLPTSRQIEVAANANGVNDFIVLPALESVPVGHTITVVANAAGHEVRTPADSDEEINSENCDGTKEYAIAAGGQVHRFTKISDTIGWMGQGFTALGAVVTAVVPD